METVAGNTTPQHRIPEALHGIPSPRPRRPTGAAADGIHYGAETSQTSVPGSQRPRPPAAGASANPRPIRQESQMHAPATRRRGSAVWPRRFGLSLITNPSPDPPAEPWRGGFVDGERHRRPPAPREPGSEDRRDRNVDQNVGQTWTVPATRESRTGRPVGAISSPPCGTVRYYIRTTDPATVGSAGTGSGAGAQTLG
jgi:hypothetical protein